MEPLVPSLLFSVRGGGAATNSRDWWEEALRRDPFLTIQIMPRATQRLHPEVVVDVAFPSLARKLESSNRTQLQAIADKIAPEIWEDRDNVLKWYEAGLPFLPNQHPKNDKEICLLMARHCRHRDFRIGSFREASSPALLRSDKDFMMQVLQIDPTLFVCASSSLQKDFDVIVAAFAKLHYWDAVQIVEDDRQDLAKDFEAQATRRLDLCETFYATVPFGVMRKGSSGSAAPLSMLNQGTETSASYVKLIAEYLGLPTSVGGTTEQLRLVRRARDKVKDALEDRLAHE